MAITTYDQLVSAFASAQSFLFSKASIANQGAGGYTSLWRATGLPTQPTIPTATVATCITAVTDTTGAFNYGMSVTTGLSIYIAKMAVCGSVSHAMFFADRLVHNGGLVANATTLTTFNSFDLPDDRGLDLTNYTDIHWFYEIYTDIGTTGTTVTFTYDSPTSSVQTVAVAIGGTSPLGRAGRMFEIPPNAGHPIVRIKSSRLTATTGTAGSWGIVAVHEHGLYPMGQVNVGSLFDFAQVGLHEIPITAHMFMYVLSSTTSSGIVSGLFRFVKG